MQKSEHCFQGAKPREAAGRAGVFSEAEKGRKNENAGRQKWKKEKRKGEALTAQERAKRGKKGNVAKKRGKRGKERRRSHCGKAENAGKGRRRRQNEYGRKGSYKMTILL